MKKYQTLFAGIIRQKGDEVRRLGTIGCDGCLTVDLTRKQRDAEFEFHPVSLIGHVILQSDLMIAEFRRPL